MFISLSLSLDGGCLTGSFSLQNLEKMIWIFVVDGIDDVDI